MIFDKASAYGRVFVVEDGRRRVLCVRTPEDANTLVFATRRSSAPQAVQLRARAQEIDGRRLLLYALAPLAGGLGRCL